MRKEVELTLSEKIGSKAISSTGSHLFFPENMLSEKYRNLFGIENTAFDEAFRIVTGGVGNELSKINSLTSSSLLSLLVFYPLFDNNAKESLTLSVFPSQNEDKNLMPFHRCFFEVRNKVIRRPSCVDVVLQSKDKKMLLFLESKFMEFEETTSRAAYGKGYHELYANYLQSFLKGIKIDTNEKNKTKLSSDFPIYLEGIKQSISHLIGLVRGPKDETSVCYTKRYLDDYSEAYQEADTLVYGTILFNPIKFNGDSLLYSNYVNSYTEIIGKQGNGIVEGIRKWCRDTNKNDKGKDIIVLETPLTYQNDLPANYKERLPFKVRDFYLL